MPAIKFSARTRFPLSQQVLFAALRNRRLYVEYRAGRLTWQTQAKSCRRLMRKYEKQNMYMDMLILKPTVHVLENN